VRSIATSVGMSVCPLAYLKTKFSVTVDRSFSGDNAMRYVLPVLWMTWCLSIMAYVVHGEDGV